MKLLTEPTLSLEAVDREKLLARLLTPTPRLRESSVIAQSRQVTAMIDVSDGLGSDVGHICERSQTGVRIWAEDLPIQLPTRHVADLTSIPSCQLTLMGGEDYELCFTAPSDAVEELILAVQQATGITHRSEV